MIFAKDLAADRENPEKYFSIFIIKYFFMCVLTKLLIIYELSIDCFI